MLRFWPWLAAILSGILLVFCFPPFNQEWLCWVALTPLIAAIWFGQKGKWRPALLGYVTGLVFFLGAFSWLITVTALGWFLLMCYLALFFAVWGAFCGALGRFAGDFTRSSTNLCVGIAGAAAWVALEWSRERLFSGFGWNGLGVALHANVFLIQIAEFTGVGGLSFLVALTNLVAVATVRRFRSEIGLGKLRPHWDFSAAMALIGVVFAFGVHAVFRKVPAEPGTPLTYAAVQANIPETEKMDLVFEKQIFDRYTFYSNLALLAKPQLLIWPEAATPRPMMGDQVNYDFVRGFAARDDVNFLLGTIDFDEDDGGHDYNVAALLTDRGQKIQTYRKMHLVPFGEFIPFRHSFPLFAWIVGDLVPGDLTPGKEPVVLQMSRPVLKVGALVCFEDTLGDLTRQFVRRGAQLLVNLTNDAWFKTSQGSEQHLANAVFRAVENRRPLLRAANTGVTASIDPLGRIESRLSSFTEGILAGTIQVPPLNARQTFYTRYGEVFSQVCILLSLVLLPLLWRVRK